MTKGVRYVARGHEFEHTGINVKFSSLMKRNRTLKVFLHTRDKLFKDLVRDKDGISLHTACGAQFGGKGIIGIMKTMSVMRLNFNSYS